MLLLHAAIPFLDHRPEQNDGANMGSEALVVPAGFDCCSKATFRRRRQHCIPQNSGVHGAFEELTRPQLTSTFLAAQARRRPHSSCRNQRDADGHGGDHPGIVRLEICTLLRSALTIDRRAAIRGTGRLCNKTKTCDFVLRERSSHVVARTYHVAFVVRADRPGLSPGSRTSSPFSVSLAAAEIRGSIGIAEAFNGASAVASSCLSLFWLCLGNTVLRDGHFDGQATHLQSSLSGKQKTSHQMSGNQA